MKFIYLFVCFLAMASISFAQKTKTVEIWKKPITGETLQIMYIEHKDTGLIDTLVHFMAQDHQYQELTHIITLYAGTPKGFYNYLNNIEKFFKENEPNTSDYIDGHKIDIVEMVKVRGIWISEKREQGNGYHGFSPKALNKFKSKFVDWCKKNNVPYE